MKNKVIRKLIKKETRRQNRGIELIASENYPSRDVYEATGSILQAKYAEGYPDARYYGGCEYIDKIEKYAIESAKKLFGCQFANVQPHSGSQANAAAFYAMMPNGGKILSMKLNDGGHITHTPLSSVGNRNYEFCYYGLNEDGYLNYENILNVALKELPNVILCGFSAYPYIIDFTNFHNICAQVEQVTGRKCYLMVDMAHIAGLIAAHQYPSPFPHADVVTSTTQKTLRGPRGGLILTNKSELAKKIDSAVFPRSQGGPLMHVIAAKAICFQEALKKDYVEYIGRVLENTAACARILKEQGAKVSDTETHLFLLNTWESFGVNGRDCQEKLEKIGITTNKNMMPGDTFKPNETSGLRIGFAALTSRGCTKEMAEKIGILIARVLTNTVSNKEAKKEIREICSKLKKVKK